MSNWGQGVLADEVAELEAGVSVNSEDRPCGFGEIGVLKTSSLSGGVFNAQENKAILPSERSRARVSPQADSILVSRMNTPALVGESAYVKDTWPDLFLPDRVWQLRVRDRERCCVRWVAHLLRSHSAKTYISLSATGTSGSMKNLPKARLLAMPVSWPSPIEQRRIAEILDTLDEATRKTEQLIAKLRQVKQGLLHDLLTRGIDDNGDLRDPERHPELFKDSELGQVPSGWSLQPFMQLVTLPSGQLDPRAEPYRSWVLVAPDHIESGTGRLLDKQTAAAQGAISGKYGFLPGDVLYSKIRPYLRKAVLADFEGLCSADMYPLRASRDVNPRFLLALILGENFSRFAEGVSMRSGFPKINRDELAEYSVRLPPKAEQDYIAGILEAENCRQLHEFETLEKLRVLKHGLMEDLLTGRVCVTSLLNEAAA